MKLLAWKVLVASVGLSVAFGQAFAQDGASPCTIGAPALTGVSFAGVGAGPYSATLKTTFEQRLPDGNVIHGGSRVTQARSSDGKTMREQGWLCERGLDGQPELSKSVYVQDMAKHEFLDWKMGPGVEKIVHLFHPTLPVPPVLPEQHKPTSEEIEARKKRARMPPTWKSEDLGAREIAGVMATGTRMTRTIPAGEAGNDLPLVTMNETWKSKELGLILLEITDDPRRGRTTTELEDLALVEPDPALFLPPRDYTIKELKPAEEVVVSKP